MLHVRPRVARIAPIVSSPQTMIQQPTMIEQPRVYHAKEKNRMQKLATFVFALLVAGSLSFAQAGGDKTKAAETPKADSGKKATKTSKAHKGGKKNKKGSSSKNAATTK